MLFVRQFAKNIKLCLWLQFILQNTGISSECDNNDKLATYAHTVVAIEKHAPMN
jgi:hypothetical protein